MVPKENFSSVEDIVVENGDRDDGDNGACTAFVSSIQHRLRTFYEDHRQLIWITIYSILILLYFCYFGYAMYYRFGDEGSIRLLTFTIFGVMFIIHHIVMTLWGQQINECLKSALDCVNSQNMTCVKRNRKIVRWLYVSLVLAYAIFAIVWLIVDVGLDHQENLVSAAGLAFFILVFYVFSYNPAKVKWRPVLLGLYIQFALALIMLRWDVGFQAFNWLGMRVQEFSAHSDDGAIFVFGEQYEVHYFAFKVLPVIIYFSAMMSMLYYVGAMQLVVRHISRVVAFAMGTSACESFYAIANIFLGMGETPLVIKPFIARLTKSELHGVLTSGFATVASGTMAAYISYGIPATHLITASVISAPAALALSKLSYPETKKIKLNDSEVYKMEKSNHDSIIAAASAGASSAISLVANIAANVFAFIAVKHFVNSTLIWFGHRVGLYEPELTFELICSYVFWPVAYLMGVRYQDCGTVAELIGVKTFINELVAYVQLSELIKNRHILAKYQSNMTLLGWKNATWTYVEKGIYLNATDKILIGGILAERSEVLAVYALCGFANISSMGLMIGILGYLAPTRRKDVTSVVVRAMVTGNVASLLTACIAGLLYRPRINSLSVLLTNSTA